MAETVASTSTIDYFQVILGDSRLFTIELDHETKTIRLSDGIDVWELTDINSKRMKVTLHKKAMKIAVHERWLDLADDLGGKFRCHILEEGERLLILQGMFVCVTTRVCDHQVEAIAHIAEQKTVAKKSKRPSNMCPINPHVRKRKPAVGIVWEDSDD
jgi:hypothetical protein